MTITALIVDDEPLARRRIRRFLRNHPDIAVGGECGDGEEALAALRETPADLLFLDVQMPDLDGFALLKAARSRRPPVVIFTTAFDDYAVRAFEVNALDYLVKPFSRARFDESVARARASLAGGGDTRLDARLETAMDQLARRPLTRLVVKRDGRSLFVDVDDVTWIEADRNQVVLHTDRAVFPYGESISHLESRLDPSRFARIHRSTIVNVERIVEMQPWFRGDAVLILRDGTRLTMSRTHRPRLAALLGQAI
jgi:two-component system LytT family response regulator